MARPERNNVDYFPFLCKEGKAMFYIEETYGNDGFATWIKILRQIATNNYHYIDLSNKMDLMHLSAKCKVTKDVLISIINDLVEMGEFDQNLWVEKRVLWNEKFIENIQDAYKKRGNSCIDKKSLLLLLGGKLTPKQSKSTPKHRHDLVNSPVNPHSIREYTIREESRVEESRREDIDLNDKSFLEKPNINLRNLEEKTKKKSSKNSEVSVLKKEPSLHTLVIGVYNEFCLGLNNMPAKIDGGDASAVKPIIQHLKNAAKTRVPEIAHDDMLVEKKALEMWELTLLNYNKWDSFHQSQISLKKINSNLSDILNKLTNGKPKQQSGLVESKSIREQSQDILNSPEFQRRRDSSGTDASKHLTT